MTVTADETKELLDRPTEIKRFDPVNWWIRVKESVVAAQQTTGELATDRTDEALNRLSAAEMGDIQTIAATQIDLLTSHYEMILKLARKNFKAAKFALVVGALFFTAAIMLLLTGKSPAIVIISFVGAVLAELISSVNFYFYWKTISQLRGFHFRFDRIQSYLLANSVCERLDGEAKTASRQELIRKIAAIHDQGPYGQTTPGDESEAPGETKTSDWKY